MTVGAAMRPVDNVWPASRVGRPPAAHDDAKTASAARDFEAMALDQMLQPMFATVGTDPLFGGGDAEKVLQPMLVTEMAKLMEERGGLGLSQAIDTKMLQLQQAAG